MPRVAIYNTSPDDLYSEQLGIHHIPGRSTVEADLDDEQIESLKGHGVLQVTAIDGRTPSVEEMAPWSPPPGMQPVSQGENGPDVLVPVTQPVTSTVPTPAATAPQTAQPDPVYGSAPVAATRTVEVEVPAGDVVRVEPAPAADASSITPGVEPPAAQ